MAYAGLLFRRAVFVSFRFICRATFASVFEIFTAFCLAGE